MNPPDIRLFQAEKLQTPRGFRRINQARICLEIGAGKGRHALLFAAAHPEQHLIAIERTAEKFRVFAERAKQQNLPNLSAVHADALAWTVYGLLPQQVERVFLLYPNPEPKNPAARWLNMPFFEFLLSRLQDGGDIVLASNIAAYLDEAAVRCETLWQLPFTRHAVAADSARTAFEIKYLARGESCGELRIVKPAGYVTRFDDFVIQHDDGS